MRVLVLGGSGLLGGELLRQAATWCDSVVGTYANKSAPVDDVEWRQVDVRD